MLIPLKLLISVNTCLALYLQNYVSIYQNITENDMCHGSVVSGVGWPSSLSCRLGSVPSGSGCEVVSTSMYPELALIDNGVLPLTHFFLKYVPPRKSSAVSSNVKGYCTHSSVLFCHFMAQLHRCKYLIIPAINGLVSALLRRRFTF